MDEQIKSIPVYLPLCKKEKIKTLCKKSRLSYTKWIEEAIDVKIKKEDKI